MKAIWDRRSIRRFLSEPIATETLHGLLQAAGRAPSAHNRQPWRFRIVREADEKDALAQRMGVRLRRDRECDGDDPETIRRDLKRSRSRIKEAPVLIVVCLTMEDMDCYLDDRRDRAEFLMAVQSSAMAAQNLLLAAHAVGLGACWMCAPLFSSEDVRVALSLPLFWQPQGLVLLGRPAEPGRSRDRKSVAEIAIGLES